MLTIYSNIIHYTRFYRHTIFKHKIQRGMWIKTAWERHTRYSHAFECPNPSFYSELRLALHLACLSISQNVFFFDINEKKKHVSNDALQRFLIMTRWIQFDFKNVHRRRTKSETYENCKFLQKITRVDNIRFNGGFILNILNSIIKIPYNRNVLNIIWFYFSIVSL